MKRLVSLLVTILLLSSVCYAEQNDLYDKMVELLGHYDTKTVQIVNDATNAVLGNKKTWKIVDSIMYTVGEDIVPGRYIVQVNGESGSFDMIIFTDEIDNQDLINWINKKYFRFEPHNSPDNTLYGTSIHMSKYNRTIGIDLIEGLKLYIQNSWNCDCIIWKEDASTVIGE